MPGTFKKQIELEGASTVFLFVKETVTFTMTIRQIDNVGDRGNIQRYLK